MNKTIEAIRDRLADKDETTETPCPVKDHDFSGNPYGILSVAGYPNKGCRFCSAALFSKDSIVRLITHIRDLQSEVESLRPKGIENQEI